MLSTAQSRLVDLQAIVTVITDWLLPWEAADPDWKPQLHDPVALRIRTHMLNHEAMLSDLVLTLMCYLDSQQKWCELAPRALQTLLIHLCASMQKAAGLSAQQYQHLLLNQALTWHFDSLAAASRFSSSHLCIPPGKLRCQYIA